MSRYGGDSRHGAYERGGGATERWNPERFERERAGRVQAPELVERDRYEEHDFFQPRPPRTGAAPRIRERSADGYYGRPGIDRFAEKDVYFTQERYGPPARRPRGGPAKYYEEDFDSFDEEPGKDQMISFESRQDYRPPPRRAPPRPGLLRRQSSLDTFDRKPLPRYGAPLRPPPETIVMPSRGRRRPSPPRYIERHYEERDIFDDDYHGGYRERERSTVRRRGNSDVEFREEFREEETYDVEEEEIEKPYPRKGKTRMPRRLVNKRAIIELGYPFDEEASEHHDLEEETIVILKALAKEQIDEVIKASKEMNERAESRTTYLIEAPAPEAEVVERRTEIIVGPPDKPPSAIPRSVRDWDMMSGSGASTTKGGTHAAASHAGGKSHTEGAGGGSHAGAGSVAGGHSTKGAHSTKGGHSVRTHSVSAHSEHGTGHSDLAGGHSERGGGHAQHEGGQSEHGGHSDHHSRASHRSPSPTIITRQPSHSHSRHRSRSKHYIEKEIGESNSIAAGPLALAIPHHSKKDEKSLKAEIRALEAEKKMLRYEREIDREHRKASRYKSGEGEVIIERSSRHREPEIVIERPEREVKIEKDKKAPTPGMIKAMLATLT